MKNIIQENSLKIKQIIKKITGNYNEDLEQEVYIKTYKNLNKYREENKFTQWISTIAANLCRDYLRSKEFKKNNLTIANEEYIETTKGKSSPEYEYIQKERQKYILKEIYSLPEKLKKVIILYEFENYSYETISKKLKIPQGTVKSRLNKAREILKLKLNFLMKEEN